MSLFHLCVRGTRKSTDPVINFRIKLTVTDGFGIFRCYILISQICTKLKSSLFHISLFWYLSLLLFSLECLWFALGTSEALLLTSTCCEMPESNWPVVEGTRCTSKVIQLLLPQFYVVYFFVFLGLIFTSWLISISILSVCMSSLFIFQWLVCV